MSISRRTVNVVTILEPPSFTSPLNRLLSCFVHYYTRKFNMSGVKLRVDTFDDLHSGTS